MKSGNFSFLRFFIFKTKFLHFKSKSVGLYWSCYYFVTFIIAVYSSARRSILVGGGGAAPVRKNRRRRGVAAKFSDFAYLLQRFFSKGLLLQKYACSTIIISGCLASCSKIIIFV